MGGRREILTDVSAVTEPRVGHEEQGHEQDDHRRRWTERGEVTVVPGQVASEVSLGQTDHDGAHEGQRDRPETTEDRRGVCIDDQQGERAGLEREGRGDENSTHPGEEAAHRPTESRYPVRTGAVEQGQGAVVDVRPHRHADAGPVQQPAQARSDYHRDEDRDPLVVGDRRHEHVDSLALEERPERTAVARLPDDVRNSDQPHQEADRHDQSRGLAGTPQSAHYHAVDQQPDRGRQHPQRQDERHRSGHPPGEAELPVREGHEHADRTVREVEDAGGRVREDESAGDDRVDGRQRQADNGEDQELVHGTNYCRSSSDRPSDSSVTPSP